MNKGASGDSVRGNKYRSGFEGRHNPAQRLFVDRHCSLRPTSLSLVFNIFPGTQTIMTKLRLVLLATTTLTVMHVASAPSHAQTAPLVMAQATTEPGREGKQPPAKGAPPSHPGGQGPGAQPHQGPPASTVQTPHNVTPTTPTVTAPIKPTITPNTAPATQFQHKGTPSTGSPETGRTTLPPSHLPPTNTQPTNTQTHPVTPTSPTVTTPTVTTPTVTTPTVTTKPTVTPGTTPSTEFQKKGPPSTSSPLTPGTGGNTPPASVHTGPPPNNTVPNAVTGPGTGPATGGAGQTALPSTGGAPLAHHAPPTVNTALPTLPARTQVLTPIVPGAALQGPRRMEDFRGERRETQEGGRTVFNEPGRMIVVDPGGQSFIRHDEMDRFRFGARDIQTRQVGGETQIIVIRPDGSQIITVTGRDGQLLRRIRRDQQGREIIIIDNSYRDPRAVGGFYVDLPPPVIRIPYDRYIVDAESASPDLIYDTMEAPPVDRIDRRYSLDEIRYSPSVRMLMPSIDLNSINFATGSWDIPPDQAAKLQAIADGLNRAITRNPREVFLIEGHTDAVGSDVDNLSLSDRRAESAAELLTQQFQVPAENLTSQGYGKQYLKEQTDGPSLINRRVTIRRITPLLNGGTASLPPPPPGVLPPR
jgi:OmpA-OmpF porin, OOP family